ncbi:MAG: dihydrolipoamide acetyltransferase family protein [Zetaproteobacteria bacterium]|nr:dihydrolipoamide acetyltransferase family protein [Zetaproteobacteria bacterium]
MAVIIAMPKLSDTMEEGSIAEWLLEEGSQVEEGDALVAIDTDKATMEYASPEEGVLLQILVQAGQTASLQQPIAVLGAKGEKFNLETLLQAAPNTASTPATDEPAPSESTNTPPAAPIASSSPAQHGEERIKASPVAKRVAAQKGLDLSTLTGSGPNGRIILQDVEQAPAAPTSGATSPAAAATALAPQRTPHTMMRKTIAKRLLQAKNEAPHFYLTVCANMSAMIQWRQQLNADCERTGAVKVSMNDLIMMVTARTLRKHPEINCSWQENEIIAYNHVDLAMAVALPSGLITPVVRHADTLGARAMASATKAMAQQAKDGTLQPSDYTRGTFTISNLGMTRVESFTAIINPPQAAILAVGRTVKTPVVNELDEIVIQPQMKMTLSCDHRAIDGMVGAKFLESLCAALENPLDLLT